MPDAANPPGSGVPSRLRLTFGLEVQEEHPAPSEDAAHALLARIAEHLPEKGRTLLVASESFPGRQYFLNRNPETEFLLPGEALPAGPFHAICIHECALSRDPFETLIRNARARLAPDGVLVISGPVRHGPEETSWPFAPEQAASLFEEGFCLLAREQMGGQIRVFPAASPAETSETVVRSLQEEFQAGRLGYEILSGRKDPRFVRSYRPGDEKRILSMFREQFHVERSPAHFRWKYLENPNGGPCISLIFSLEGVLLAHYAGYPVPFLDTVSPSPALRPAMHVGDTMTRPEGRRVGLGPTSLVAQTRFHFSARHLEDASPFAYGFNTGRIRKFGARYLEYSYLETVPLWTRELTIAASRPLPLSRIFGGWSAETVQEPSDEFDVFFRNTASRYGLLARRESAYLRWRYLERPDRSYILLAVRRRGRLMGWGVFASEADRILWGDALFDTDDPGAVNALLHAAREKWPRAASIQAWFSPRPAWWSDVLRRCGFSETPEPQGLTFCYKLFSRPDLRATLKERLYYTWGDGDLF